MIFSKRLIIGVLFVFNIFLLSCGSEGSSEALFKAENSTKYDEKFELTDKVIKRFPLDDRTSFFSLSYRVDHFEDAEWFSFLNPMTNSLYVYDAKSRELANVVKLEEEGPNGVGKLTIAAHLMLADGGFYLFNTWQGRLYNVGPDGAVRNKYSVIDYKVESSSSNPEPSQSAPLVRRGDDIYIVCSMDAYQTDYSETYVMMVYNVNEKGFRFVYTYPEIYNSGYWGPYFKYTPGFTYNDKTDRMILNFAIDPNLHEMGLDGKEVAQHYESSSLIAEMPPLRADINYGKQKDHNVADPEQREYGLTTSDFSKILYDTHRDVYYRVAYIRPSKDQYRSGSTRPDFTISVLDRSFKKVAERKFSGKDYDLNLILVGEEGLLMGRNDLYAEDEEFLPVSILTMEPR